jgi:DNA-binding NarL/FixJ family response regulator
VRILVVDDSAAVRARVVALLRVGSGVCVIDEASSADEGLAMAQARAPHLVVLDVQMPDKSGIAILSCLKAAPTPPVVVVLTNHATEYYERECLANGADFFFDKSVHFDRLLDVVQSDVRLREVLHEK